MGVALSTCFNFRSLTAGIADSSSPVDRRDPLQHPVVQYIKRYGACLVGRQLVALQFTGDAKEIPDVRTRHMRNTSMGWWIKSWWHWGGHGATDSLFHFLDIENSFAKCFQEAGNERRPGDILHHLQAAPVRGWARDLAELIGLTTSLRLRYLLENRQYLVCNVDFE